MSATEDKAPPRRTPIAPASATSPTTSRASAASPAARALPMSIGAAGPPRRRDPEARIKRLAIPPAWTDVWISPDPDGHIQATGRDARGRKQYRYHPRLPRRRGTRPSTSACSPSREALPAIRRRVASDMGRRGLPREKVLATVVHLLDTTLIRVGNDEYAAPERQLRADHAPRPPRRGRRRRAPLRSSRARAARRGTSSSRTAASPRIVKSCQDLPGQHLFQYVDDDGARHAVGSADVNAYLREVTGARLHRQGFPHLGRHGARGHRALASSRPSTHAVTAKANVRDAIERVARRLGNTPTICRKCYVHPEVLDSYLDGALALDIERRAEAELHGDLDAPPSRGGRGARLPQAAPAAAGEPAGPEGPCVRAARGRRLE